MARKKIENEIEGWMDDMPDELQESFLELVEVDDDSISMTIGEEEHAFTISYPKEYPNGGQFSLFSEDSELFQWQQMINEFAERMPKLKIAQLLEEMAERYLKLSGGEGDDEEMEGMDLRQSQGGFDSVVGSALAKEAKKRVLELEKIAKANGRAVGFVDYDESNSIIRAAVPVNFLDAITAKVWGVNKEIPIIVELKFHLEDMNKPPAFSLIQSGDRNLADHKLKDVHSFGLEWQLRARIDDWLNGGKESKSKPNWPPKDGDFIGKVMDHIVERVKDCTKTCIICDGPLPFQMIKPAVCDRNLCVHSHEQYGLGADVASELRDNPQVIDLLISFCYAISQGDHRRFNPYPIGVEAKVLDNSIPEKRKEITRHFMAENDDKVKNLAAVKQVLDLLPAVADLAKKTDSKSLAAYLDTIDPLCFPLLRWIITSNRAHLAKLEKDDMLPEVNTEYQYMFLSSPPEKEAKFQEFKKAKGSFWAFHGSAFANWHSILRIGLKNYSNTELMSCGAAYGAGIYLSPFSSTSAGYAHSMTGWPNSAFLKGNLTCVAICEVIDDGYKANPHYVVPNEDYVMTRYFLIYNSQYTCPSLEANKLKNLRSSPLANMNDKKGSGGILKKILG